jgi:hypothetical protein
MGDVLKNNEREVKKEFLGILPQLVLSKRGQLVM